MISFTIIIMSHYKLWSPLINTWTFYKYWTLDYDMIYDALYEYTDEVSNIYLIVETLLDAFYFYWFDEGPDENYDLDYIGWDVIYFKYATLFLFCRKILLIF